MGKSIIENVESVKSADALSSGRGKKPLTMWAVKGHYYSPSLAFYNYPYAFGLLFSLSLYAKAQDSAAVSNNGMITF